ncbi:DUF982 domain-containing protein [Ochrobactrum sp. RH2CCR150]|uniref:DUF982 domain-containing protein n=1 Tax=Ochrobactrum sp. RH2CCR150 TaxID=2587044 RepID=UPI0015F8F3DF|nr:hypothetical protein [Ochrobactrum sp. RH2CCR150]
MTWGHAISIEVGGLGRCIVVDSTAAAAEYLIESWPYEAKGKEYWRALETCLAEIDGESSKARKYFIAAAKAAALNIMPATVH